MVLQDVTEGHSFSVGGYDELTILASGLFFVITISISTTTRGHQ